MNIRVIYHSKTGNTKKLAESMAGALCVAAETAAESRIVEPVDMLFIGDGVYGGRPDISTVKY